MANWPRHKQRFVELFRSKTRAEWCALLEGTDVCFAPVLNFPDAQAHPHNRARQAYIEIDGVTHPAPAPRFSATPAEVGGPAPAIGADNVAVLEGIGYPADEIAALTDAGVV